MKLRHIPTPLFCFNGKKKNYIVLKPAGENCAANNGLKMGKWIYGAFLQPIQNELEYRGRQKVFVQADSKQIDWSYLIH